MAFSINDKENLMSHSDRNKPILLQAVCSVINLNAIDIIKDGCSGLKLNAMLLIIQLCLAAVPFKFKLHDTTPQINLNTFR